MTQTLPYRLTSLPPSPDWASAGFSKQQAFISKVLPASGIDLQTGCNFDVPLHVAVRDILVHLYSANTAYQRRALSMFYHPTMSQYSDMFVSVNGTKAVEKLFALYFGLLVQDVEHSFEHITSSLVHGRMQSSSAVPIPFTKATAREWDGPVWSVSVDHTLRVSLSTLGRFLAMFQVLPVYLKIASSPSGLRVSTKLEWIEDPSCTNHSRGTVLRHHDEYSVQTYLDFFVLAPFVMFFNVVLKFSSFVLPQLRRVSFSAQLVKKLLGFVFIQIFEILSLLTRHREQESPTVPTTPVNGAVKKRN